MLLFLNGSIMHFLPHPDSVAKAYTPHGAGMRSISYCFLLNNFHLTRLESIQT